MDRSPEFFISYTGKDLAWAEWIAWILEAHGYTTLIQAWDFKSASNFVLNMQTATTDSARTLAVITPDYFESAFTRPEWAAAFASDPKSENGKLIAIRVADFKPPGLFKSIIYIDVVGLEESAAEERIAKSIDVIVTGKRLKPDCKPAFPGVPSLITRPPFPGTPANPTTFQHNLPFAPNPFFTGREKKLEDLRSALCSKTSAAITQPQAVHGLGGVGKTQLAIEYAWRYQSHYDVALWVSASSVNEFHANTAALTRILQLAEPDTKEQAARIQVVVDWLCTHQRWLLILDNVDSQDTENAVTKLLPPGLQGHIIVTSRHTNWPVHFADLEIPVLSETAAVEFLVKRSAKASFMPGSHAEALAIAKELGCLPLALEQAGAYIAKHRVTFQDYLHLLKESRSRLLTFPSQGGTGYQQTVASTWLVSEQQLSVVGRIVLQLTAFLAPHNIPRDIFVGGSELLSSIDVALIKDFHPECPRQLPREVIQDALAELHDHSLINLEPNVIACHRLVQAVLLDRLALQLKQEWLNAAIHLLADAAKHVPPEPTTWPFWRQLQPQIESVLQHQGTNLPTPACVYVSEQLAQYYQQTGDYLQSELLMRKAVASTIASSSSPSNVISCKISLADLLFQLAQFDEAEAICRELIDTCEADLHVANAVFSLPLTILARIMEARGRFSEAEKLYERNLDLIERNEIPCPIELAAAINNLGDLMATTNRFNKAEELFRRSLTVMEKHLAANDPNIATIVGNLAGCLGKQGNLTKEQSFFDEAEQLYRRAMAMDEAVFGHDHPVFARDANNLGLLLHAVGKWDEAEQLFRISLQIEESKRHQNHPAIASSLNNWGRLLTSRKRFDEAKEVLKRAIAINASSLGKNNHTYATCLTNLAFALMGCGEIDHAEALFKEALVIDEACFGAKHVEIGDDLFNLADALIKKKHYIEAEGLLRRALRIYETCLGTHHLRSENARSAIEVARGARLIDIVTSKHRRK